MYQFLSSLKLGNERADIFYESKKNQDSIFLETY